MATEAFAQWLRRVLEIRGVPPSTSDDELLRHARRPRHKLGVTLLSAWAAEGRELSPAQREELTAQRARIEAYRQVWSDLRGVAPSAYLVKGPGVAAHYPPGILRAAGDLDVICHDPGQLWAAAGRLRSDGWSAGAFGVLARAGGDAVHFLVELRRPATAPNTAPLAVGMSTVDVGTNLRAGPRWLPDPTGSAIATNLVAITAERWERPFTSRDLIDLTLLRPALTEPDVAALRAGLSAVGLWPEWRELTRAAAPLDPGADGWPEPPAGTLPRTWLTRGFSTARWWTHPLRLLGSVAASTVERDRGRLADWLSAVLHERVGADRLRAAGLPLFGVPLDPPEPTGAGTDLVRHGRLLSCRTPVGSFLLASGACRSEWLDRVSA
jgi:hypothetical protein